MHEHVTEQHLFYYRSVYMACLLAVKAQQLMWLITQSVWFWSYESNLCLAPLVVSSSAQLCGNAVDFQTHRAALVHVHMHAGPSLPEQIFLVFLGESVWGCAWRSATLSCARLRWHTLVRLSRIFICIQMLLNICRAIKIDQKPSCVTKKEHPGWFETKTTECMSKRHHLSATCNVSRWNDVNAPQQFLWCEWL